MQHTNFIGIKEALLLILNLSFFQSKSKTLLTHSPSRHPNHQPGVLFLSVGYSNASFMT